MRYVIRYKFVNIVLIFFVIMVWLYSGWPVVWDNPVFPPVVDNTSAATGQMILLWDQVDIPVGWTCISCAPGDDFYQKFIRGAATYSAGGLGNATHTHTALGTVYGDAGTQARDKGGTGTIARYDHTHTLTPTIVATSSLPSFRQLKVIRYNSTGEPSELPNGAIAFFDATVSGNWVSYSAQNGYFIRGENTASTIGGANTHRHDITGTTSQSSAAGLLFQTGASAAPVAHTHTIASLTGIVNNQPPYIQVILGKLTTTSTPSEFMIAMWNNTPSGGWNIVSDAGSGFYQNFILPAAAYNGTASSTASHLHANVTGITSSDPSGSGVVTQNVAALASLFTHTHSVDVTGFSNVSHLPPYVDVIFAKKINQKYKQTAYRWFNNTNSTAVGATLAASSTKANLTSTGQAFRLRLLMQVASSSLDASQQSFKLQFATSTTDNCDTGFVGENYNDVSPSAGDIRFNDNPTPVDQDLLTSTSTDPIYGTDGISNQTYEEANNFTATSTILTDVHGKWDFSLIDYSAPQGSIYCFRVVKSDDSLLDEYFVIPEIKTNLTGTLYVEIVDGSGNPVTTPSTTMSTLGLSFSCQSSNGTLGVSSEKIRVHNDTGNPQWTLNIATSTTAYWDGASADYDFNDESGSPPGCSDGGDADALAGQMSIDLSGAVSTPEGGFTNTDLSFGTSDSFGEITTSTITLMTAGSGADTGCYWDLTGIDISQQVPAEQAVDNYSINMVITVTAY